MKKICSVCKEEKDIIFFNWKSKKDNKKHSRCKSCQKEFDKRYYLLNEKRRTDIRKRADEWNFELKEWFIELKNGLSCKKCGDNRSHVLDFHHVNPQEKDFTISGHTTSSREKILEEVKKCIVLCSNCHRDFHYYERINGISIEKYLMGL
jgi:protein-arginine kinase activator protein McsA